MICNKTQTCFYSMLSELEIDCQQHSLCFYFCDKRVEAVCREKGKVYRLDNRASAYKILAIHVDGGVVIVDALTPPATCKCDYLYLVEMGSGTAAILIELKGKDINHAIEQIENTLILCKEALKKCSNIYGRIVFGGGTPNLQNTPQFVRLQKELKRKNGNLKASTMELADSCLMLR